MLQDSQPGSKYVLADKIEEAEYEFNHPKVNNESQAGETVIHSIRDDFGGEKTEFLSIYPCLRTFMTWDFSLLSIKGNWQAHLP